MCKNLCFVSCTVYRCKIGQCSASMVETKGRYRWYVNDNAKAEACKLPTSLSSSPPSSSSTSPPSMEAISHSNANQNSEEERSGYNTVADVIAAPAVVGVVLVGTRPKSKRRNACRKKLKSKPLPHGEWFSLDAIRDKRPMIRALIEALG